MLFIDAIFDHISKTLSVKNTICTDRIIPITKRYLYKRVLPSGMTQAINIWFYDISGILFSQIPSEFWEKLN